jgi:hypothetical protein
MPCASNPLPWQKNALRGDKKIARGSIHSAGSVSGYPADTEVPSFRSRVVCAKCGSRGTRSTFGLIGPTCFQPECFR